MNIYLDLFLTFCRIGVLTFGGGYSMLPMLEREVVNKKKWATGEELLDYYAIGQCTPGVIAVNTATFIGNKTKGTLGGIIATLGVIFPSLIIIIICAAFLNHFAEYKVVQNALAGIRLAVCALVVVAVYKMARKGIADIITLLIFLSAFVAVAFLGVSPVVAILCAALIGIVAGVIKRTAGGKKK